MDEQQYNDQLLASAVTFLMDGGEEKAATVLLSCTLTYEEEFVPHTFRPEEGSMQGVITLMAPRISYDLLHVINIRGYYYEDSEVPDELIEEVSICTSIRRAFHALIDSWFAHF